MLIDEVTSYLVANAIGVTGVDIFVGSIPDRPDDVVGCYEYPGEPPLSTKDRRVYEHPRFQVLTRSKSYQVARLKAERIYQTLDGARGEFAGVNYAGIYALQSPFFLDRDDANRALIVTNYRAVKELSPT